MPTKIKNFFPAAAAVLFFIFFPCAAKAATLYLSPSSGTYTENDSFSVSAYVSSSDQAMNAAEAEIGFPTSKLEVTSISTSGSIFNFWVQSPVYSNTTGKVNFSGIVFTPGYTGSAGKLITINFRALAAGTANVVYNSGSVLANDGQGTEILTGTSGASFTINALPAPPSAPTVTSPTHPDSDTWYESNDPVFNWTNPSGITGVRALINQTSDSVPTASIGVVQTYSATDVANGEWYFHVRLQNAGGWGATAHYRFRINAPSAPSAPTVASPTHPDSDTWYESNDPVFNWTNPSGITGVRVLIDQISNSTPTTSAGVIETYSAVDVAVGEWYFHVRLQNAGGWGGIAHYKFRINAPCPACPSSGTCSSGGDAGISKWDACPVCTECVVCKSNEIECPKTVCPVCKKSEIECPKTEPAVCQPKEKKCPVCEPPKTKIEYKEKVKVIFVEKGDAGQAIDHYEIQIDNGAPARWIPDGRAYDLPALTAGKHKITIKAVDKDGNSVSAFVQEVGVNEEKVIIKEGIREIADFSIIFLLIIILFLFFIIGILIYVSSF